MPDLEITSAWRLNNENIERQAIQFWKTLQVLPPGVEPAFRAKQLVAIAQLAGELVAVSTATIEEVKAVRSRFAMFRTLVAPEHRRSRVASEMTVYAKHLLERWSLEHPEEDVKGMAIILEAPLSRANEPVWQRSGLTLVGYTPAGHQVRLAWFEHARI